MEKVKAILLGIFTLVPFIGLSFFIYYFFPTTPALIVILILLMTGVILAFYVYTKRIDTDDSPTNKKVVTSNLPSIEKGLIYVSPADFCDKLEKTKGNLYIAPLDKVGTDITLVKGEYNKLTDEMTLSFTNGIHTVFRGSGRIAVGNNQIVIFRFKDMMLIKNKKKTAFQMRENKLLLHVKTDTTELKVKKGTPIYIFDWKED